MSRKFALISVIDLQAKIEKLGDGGFNIRAIKEHVEKDMKIEFDLENYEYQSADKDELIGYRTLDNGLSFLGLTSGGDWECPVFWIVYWSGKELRGYIPTKGNVFNSKSKSAIGNAGEEEEEEYEETLSTEMQWGEIKADIVERIQPA